MKFQFAFLAAALALAPMAAPAQPKQGARHKLIALLSPRQRLKRHVGRAGHEFPDLCQRLELGFVHVDHHPKMIDPNV